MNSAAAEYTSLYELFNSLKADNIAMRRELEAVRDHLISNGHADEVRRKWTGPSLEDQMLDRIVELLARMEEMR